MKEIRLNKGQVTLVDDENFEWLNQWKWFANLRRGHYYAVRQTKKNRIITSIKMHRLILGINDPKIKVDHIDRNSLNNQRNNLRQCTNAENCCNQKSAKNSTSKYLGVSWDNSQKKWIAQISKHRKNNYLGAFISEKEAALAYNKKAIELHGEFANLNQI